jgi:hypothetical protein
LKRLKDSRVLDFLVLPAGASAVLVATDDDGGAAAADGGGAGGGAAFVGLSAAATANALRDLLDLACAPGKVGTLATDAAANDPAFWALHVLYDRAWHEGRRAGRFNDDWTAAAVVAPQADDAAGSGEGEGSSASAAGQSGRQRMRRRRRRRRQRRRRTGISSSRSRSSDSSSECFGASAEDVLPFAFDGAVEVLSFDPDEVDAGEALSNAALVAFFDPNNEALPYAYDTFEF